MSIRRIVTKTTPSSVVSNDGTVRFIGTYDAQSFTGADKSILFLGEDNTLYYPQNGASIGACRAYFQLNGITAGDVPVSNVKMFFDDERPSLVSLPSEREAAGVWYTIDGRKVNTPSLVEGRGGLVPGIYIHNGRKVVVK